MRFCLAWLCLTGLYAFSQKEMSLCFTEPSSCWAAPRQLLSLLVWGFIGGLRGGIWNELTPAALALWHWSLPGSSTVNQLPWSVRVFFLVITQDVGTCSFLRLPPCSLVVGTIENIKLSVTFTLYFLRSLLLSRFSRVQLCATPWTVAYQAPSSTGFSRQEYWSGVPLPSLRISWLYKINALSLKELKEGTKYWVAKKFTLF